MWFISLNPNTLWAIAQHRNYFCQKREHTLFIQANPISNFQNFAIAAREVTPSAVRCSTRSSCARDSRPRAQLCDRLTLRSRPQRRGRSPPLCSRSAGRQEVARQRWRTQCLRKTARTYGELMTRWPLFAAVASALFPPTPGTMTPAPNHACRVARLEPGRPTSSAGTPSSRRCLRRRA